jgi:hypothetical protein
VRSTLSASDAAYGELRPLVLVEVERVVRRRRDVIGHVDVEAAVPSVELIVLRSLEIVDDRGLIEELVLEGRGLSATGLPARQRRVLFDIGPGRQGARTVNAHDNLPASFTIERG